jgi:hypothetical protein
MTVRDYATFGRELEGIEPGAGPTAKRLDQSCWLTLRALDESVRGRPDYAW